MFSFRINERARDWLVNTAKEQELTTSAFCREIFSLGKATFEVLKDAEES